MSKFQFIQLNFMKCVLGLLILILASRTADDRIENFVLSELEEAKKIKGDKTNVLGGKMKALITKPDLTKNLKKRMGLEK